MNPQAKWKLIHKYRREMQGKILCTCENEYLVSTNEEGTPIFVCKVCRVKETPGIDFYMRLEREINERN